MFFFPVTFVFKGDHYNLLNKQGKACILCSVLRHKCCLTLLHVMLHRCEIFYARGTIAHGSQIGCHLLVFRFGEAARWQKKMPNMN